MTDTPTKTDLILEGLQMGMEANAASMILINARIQMIADHIGLDVSTPPLTEVEEKNKDHMLKSVAQRVGNLMKMAAAIEGHPEPSPSEMADALQMVKDGVWPEGSITGTGRTSSTEPNTSAAPQAGSPTGRIANREPEIQNINPRTPEGQAIREAMLDQFPTPDPFKGSIFEGAEPVDPSEVNMFLDDTTADEDTEAMMASMGITADVGEPALPPGVDAMLDDGTMVEFKTARPVVKLNPKDEFTVHVWELDGFTDVDFADPESRKAGWDVVVQFYCDAAKAAVKENWLSQPWADRLRQEFMLSPEHPEITSSLTLPDPSDVTAGVAQTAADGEAEIAIKGMTDESQVVEAIMTAFMVTAARYNMNIGQALLDARMSQLGLQA